MGFFSKDIKTLDDLFVHTLRDIYYAEKQIEKALPKMIAKATDPDLAAGFDKHLQETKGHVARVEQVFTLAGDIAEADNLIIFDAAQINASPGTIRVFEGDDLDSFLSSGRRSVHEVGFADLMDIARLQDSLPANRALIGIQPEVLGWGDSTGESVTAAIPRAADSARALIDKWSRR
jgi:hydrogenase maturation protease